MYKATRISNNLFFIFLIILIFYTNPSHAFAKENIRVNGSGACLEMIRPLMDAYGKDHKNVSFQMEKPLGSSGAIKALLAGAIDIAIVARPLKNEEIAGGAKLKKYGKTPLAIVAEKKVPVNNISTGDLEDIYFGKKVKWPNGENIRIILRPRDDTDTIILKSLSPQMAKAVTKAGDRRGVMVAITDNDAAEALLKTDGSIGTAALTIVAVGKLPLKIVSLNGARPTRKNLENKTYPLAKEINFVTTARLSGDAAKFIEFIYSKKGRPMAEKTGVLITLDNK